ncbi:MAG: hypothetical protein AAF844_00080 [Pseudomonadota bacterium]
MAKFEMPKLKNPFAGKRAVKPTAEKAETSSEEAAAGISVRQILGSTLLFRSTVGALVLMAAVQWALIFFNYWR